MASATTQQRLVACLTALKTQIAQHPDGRCRTPRFDKQLFTTTGTRLADYLLEIERNLQRFGSCQNAQERPCLAGGKTAEPDCRAAALGQHSTAAPALAESLAAQQQLKQDLEVLESRLARCRQAINAIKLGAFAARRHHLIAYT